MDDVGAIFMTMDTSVYGRDMAMSLTSPPIPSLQMLCVDIVLKQLCNDENYEDMASYLSSLMEYSMPPDVRERVILVLAKKKKLTKPLFDMLARNDISRINFSGTDLTCAPDDLLEDIWDISPNIEAFDFSGTEISASVFRMLVTANIHNPSSVKHVLHLNFSNSEGLTDYIADAICTSFSNLKTLNLSNCPLLTADTVSSVADAVFATSLQDLDMSYNTASPTSLQKLEALTNLHSLSLCFMKDTENAHISLVHMSSLTCLNLSALHELEDTSIECMLLPPKTHLPPLPPSINPPQSSEHSQDDQISPIHRLKELRLTESYLSSESFSRIFSKHSHQPLQSSASLALNLLDLSWTENITADALTEGVKLCTALRTLLLRSTQADNSTVVAAAENCPYLTELNVSRCNGINDVSLNELTSLHNLQSLDLSWASIQNESTVTFLQSCSTLRVLSVQGCKGLEPDVVHALLEGAAPRLKFIDLGWVNMLSASLATQLSVKRQDLIIVGEYVEVHVVVISYAYLPLA
jgi:hypothetical protein